jgi:hypothetical protein
MWLLLLSMDEGPSEDVRFKWFLISFAGGYEWWLPKVFHTTAHFLTEVCNCWEDSILR